MSVDSPAAQPATPDILIEQCLSGDQSAWETIVRQHWRKVFNVAYKFVGKHDEAEDLTQDIFLKIFKALIVTQVAAQVIGNDAAITIGGMNGHFELNVYIPLLARNLLQSIGLLASASRLLAEKCVDGIEANRERCESYAELTLSAATALNPFIGYDKASEIVKTAAASGRSLREVALEAGVEESVLDEALDYHAMAKPHGRSPRDRGTLV